MKRLLIWLLPLLIFMILGENGFGISPFLVGLILLLLFFAAGAFMDGSGCSEEEEEKEEESVSDERIRSLANNLQPFLAVKGWKAVGDVVQCFAGTLTQWRRHRIFLFDGDLVEIGSWAGSTAHSVRDIRDPLPVCLSLSNDGCS